MDDILGQALLTAKIVTTETGSTTGNTAQIQPRPQPVTKTIRHNVPTQVQIQHQTQQPQQQIAVNEQGQSNRRPIQHIAYRRSPQIQTNSDGQVLIRQNHQSNQNQNIVVIKRENVQNVQPGQTLLISNGQGNYRIAETNGATPIRARPSVPTQIKTVRRVQAGTTGTSGTPVNGQTLRIVQQSPNTPRTGRGGPQPVRRLIPVHNSSQNVSNTVQVQNQSQKNGNVTRLVPVSNVITRIPNTPTQQTPTQTQIIRNSNPSIQVQPVREPVTPNSAQIRPLRTRVVASPAPAKSNQPHDNPPRARVSVQCHEPVGSKPGFIVLQSEYIEYLRSTYTQLQRCFSQSTREIMEMNETDHALMPKLQDIFLKADQNYQNYLSNNPLKILENLKTLKDGQFVTLESFLRQHPEPRRSNSLISVSSSASPRSGLGGTPLRSHHSGGGGGGTIRNGFPGSNQGGAIRRIVKLDTDLKQESKPDMKPKEPIKPSAIQLRLNQDHRDQTNLLNIDEPFCSITDLESRLLPFHCSMLPQITSHDEALAESTVLDPFCSHMLQRKRRIEQEFRQKFQTWDCGLSMAGEDLLMEKLAIEMELDAIREKRAKLKEKPATNSQNNHSSTSSGSVGVKVESKRFDPINNNQNTVQLPVEDIDEHDNAVKGLLDVKF